MTQDDLPEDHDMLAAEYALGLLTGEERNEARRREAVDPDFAQAVTQWEARLATLTEELALVSPHPTSKKALMAKVFPAPERQSFLKKLGVWQAVSLVSLLALLLLLTLDLRAPSPAGGPLYSAEILAEAGDFRVVAVVDKSVDEVFLTLTAGAAPAGRILQVWAHGENEPAISVGLWPEGQTISLPLPPTIAAVQGTLTLGVSEEPPGGSPTGSPSGRVFGTVDIPNVAGTF